MLNHRNITQNQNYTIPLLYLSRIITFIYALDHIFISVKLDVSYRCSDIQKKQYVANSVYSLLDSLLFCILCDVLLHSMCSLVNSRITTKINMDMAEKYLCDTSCIQFDCQDIYVYCLRMCFYLPLFGKSSHRVTPFVFRSLNHLKIFSLLAT